MTVSARPGLGVEMTRGVPIFQRHDLKSRIQEKLPQTFHSPQNLVVIRPGSAPSRPDVFEILRIGIAAIGHRDPEPATRTQKLKHIPRGDRGIVRRKMFPDMLGEKRVAAGGLPMAEEVFPLQHVEGLAVGGVPACERGAACAEDEFFARLRRQRSIFPALGSASAPPRQVEKK